MSKKSELQTLVDQAFASEANQKSGGTRTAVVRPLFLELVREEALRGKTLTGTAMAQAIREIGASRGHKELNTSSKSVATYRTRTKAEINAIWAEVAAEKAATEKKGE
jgi:hypothetical protein